MTSRFAPLTLLAALAHPGIAPAAPVGHRSFEPGAEFAVVTGNVDSPTSLRRTTIAAACLNVTAPTPPSRGHGTTGSCTEPAILDERLDATFRLDPPQATAQSIVRITPGRTDIGLHYGIVFAPQRPTGIFPRQ